VFLITIPIVAPGRSYTFTHLSYPQKGFDL
jgi:hypothetical protein